MLDTPDADFGRWVAPPPTQLGTPEGRSLRDDADAVAGATPEQLERLLTAIVRSDRFVEGSIEGALRSGLLSRTSHRAAALLADG